MPFINMSKEMFCDDRYFKNHVMAEDFDYCAHNLYCATKEGITAFVKGAALDLAPKKICMNPIALGMVNTPLVNLSSFTPVQGG